jgi:IS5 family transposase
MGKAASRARDFTLRRYRWGSRVDERVRAMNRRRSRVRSKAEHSVGVIKPLFVFQKVRYRGLAKSLHRLQVGTDLANLFMVGRRLLRVA